MTVLDELKRVVRNPIQAIKELAHEVDRSETRVEELEERVNVITQVLVAACVKAGLINAPEAKEALRNGLPIRLTCEVVAQETGGFTMEISILQGELEPPGKADTDPDELRPFRQRVVPIAEGHER